jgi:hypothetical protein
MFDRQGEFTQVELIHQFFCSLPADQVATISELAAVANCKERNVSSLINVLNKRLRPTSTDPNELRLIVFVRGEGYRPALPGETVTKSVWHSKKVVRSQRRAYRAAVAGVHHPDASERERAVARELADRQGEQLVLVKRQQNQLARRRPKIVPEVPFVAHPPVDNGAERAAAREARKHRFAE